MPEIKITAETEKELDAFIAGFQLARDLADTISIYEVHPKFATLLHNHIPGDIECSVTDVYNGWPLNAS